MASPEKASLKDVLNYEHDTYFSADEISLIQNTFKDKNVLKVLRKALLPSVGDPELPMEEFGNDFWLSGRDYAQIPDSEIKSVVLGRQEAIKFIIGGLIRLRVVAYGAQETPMEAALRRAKNSSK